MEDEKEGEKACGHLKLQVYLGTIVHLTRGLAGQSFPSPITVPGLPGSAKEVARWLGCGMYPVLRPRPGGLQGKGKRSRAGAQ